MSLAREMADLIATAIEAEARHKRYCAWLKVHGAHLRQFEYCQDRMDDECQPQFQLLEQSMDQPGHGLSPYGYCLDNFSEECRSHRGY